MTAPLLTASGQAGRGITSMTFENGVVFVEAIPHTATGKILKTALRDTFRDYRLPGA